MSKHAMIVCTAVALVSSVPAWSQSSATDEIAKYRQLLAEGNPAELWEAQGEELWKKKTGPKAVSLEQCDLGKGAGVVKGAYVELPRYFKDTKKVMDLEQRLMHCRMSLQGLTQEEASKTPFGSTAKRSDIEALVAYVTSESWGLPVKAPLSHPEEKRAYEIGKKLFYYRGGAYDFACATCHSADNQRIRLQELPNMLNAKNAQFAYTTWPAYRVSQGEVRTMQHRLYDCFRQQRFPEPLYASDAITALTMFLAKSAEGGTYAAPALKR
ncbi:MAG: sulfur oxidation c-type cytochrome SoxA [Pseudomonadota bacterium]